MPPGTSLSETNRVLTHVEEMLRETPEIESYSRRTGARLALAIAEPNTGDFLVKLKTKRDRSVWEVTDELREKVESSEPAIEVEFAGILNDLIGDLVWSPAPIEIKVFSNDPKVLQTKAEEVAALIEKVDGVVDVFDGVVITGPALTVTVDRQKAAQAGLTVADVTKAANTALLGQVASSVLQGDRKVDIRVLLDPRYHQSPEDVGSVLLHSSAGGAVRLADIATIGVESGQTELRREDTRQNVAVEARLSGRDLGSAIAEIQGKVSKQISLPPGTTIEYGGLYHEQQESFRNLMFVLLMAILLVFTVLVLEFRSFIHPVAIVWGSVLSLFGVLAALLLTGTAFNIISFLGAIITIGIVAKNGILMLDFVDHLEAEGHPLLESVVISGRRRIRPVVMTSLAAALGMLPLAFGLGSGAEMLKPLAIAVIGGLAISVLFSLVATPTVFYLLRLLAAPRLEGDEWPESSDARGPLDPLPSPSGMARSPLPGTLAPEGEAS
jgi:multidrug efflux pump subunit AcrB